MDIDSGLGSDRVGTVTRIFAWMLMCFLAPILLLGPSLAKDGQPWHFLIAIPIAIGNVVLCRRIIARTKDVGELDAELGDMPQWLVARNQIHPGDKIWPFTVNRGTLSMRQGYVIVRQGQCVTGVVVTVS